MEKLYANSSSTKSGIEKYAASAALKNAESYAKHAHDRGNVAVGHVRVVNPTVTKVDVAGEVPNAIISSCLDISRWKLIDAETKKPVPLPTNRLTKYVIVTTVEKWPQGWRVIRDEPQGKSC
ncbi:MULTISPECIES: secreted protein/lipoprotein [unclassified Streptomyces]|uniref:secreted protein/lipoprotein n=1 Tax=unclassified Streptomyces TaxID=2593676 RepID=UPI0033A3CDFE